ncbi:MAG: type II toxin-antitoxin system Phd/YefM family antitoxin [Candidatus Omnitrophica bacterium]|nr:type II toxin-antitoxin system Phd/YefM family antitoxin [Candidatus Omnitrophota bacterium]
MKEMTATEVVRNFRHVLDGIENTLEEVTIIRNNRPVARILPEVMQMTALEALADLYRTIEPIEGERWLKDLSKINQRISGKVRNPWR